MSTTDNALLAITYTNFVAPSGSVVDHIAVTATASNPANNPPSQNVPPGTASVTFTNLAPDTYTFTVGAVDASGTIFGTPVSATLTVVATTVTLQIPGTVDASQP